MPIKRHILRAAQDMVDRDRDRDEMFRTIDRMMAGDNRQPCFVCEKKVKAEYCFCHLCGLVLCDVHNRQHRPGGLT